MSQEEYRTLDVGSFILANYKRYLSEILIDLPEQGSALNHHEVENTFFDISFTRLRNAVARNPDATGEKRAAILFGSLKFIASGIVKNELRKQLELSHMVYHIDADEGRNHPELVEYMPSPTVAFAAELAESPNSDFWADDVEPNADQCARMNLLRQIGHLLKPNQFKMMKLQVVDGFSLEALAIEFNTTPNSMRGRLRYMRERLAEKTGIDLKAL